jgi:hypothetical protein
MSVADDVCPSKFTRRARFSEHTGVFVSINDVVRQILPSRLMKDDPERLEHA